MKSKLLVESGGAKEWAVIFDAGDEVMRGLKQFATEQNLTAAYFTGIGALASVTTGWFNIETKRYEPTELNEQVELLSLIGDIATGSDGKPAIHAHISAARRDSTVRGGHLMKAIVRPTLELIVTETPARLRKTMRPEFGIALIDAGK